MKPKTALLVILTMAGVLLPYLFIAETRNQDILMADFHFLGYDVRAAHVFAGALITAMVIPALYFSYLVTRRSVQQVQSKGKRTAVDEAEALLEHGAYQAALDKLGEPDTPAKLIAAAQAHIGLQNRAAASPLLARAFQDFDSVPAGYLLADLHGADGGAVDTLKQIIDKAPAQAERAYHRLLKHHTQAGDWKAALDLAGVMSNHKLTLDDHLLTAWRYAYVRDQGPEKKRMEGYQQVLKEDPEFVPANLGLGETYLAAGQVEKAFRVFEQAFESSGNTVFLDKLEQFYLDQGRPDDALQIYNQLLVKNSTQVLKYRQGRLLAKLEMIDEALSVLEPMERDLGGFARYRLLLADLKARRFRQDDALADMRTAVNDAKPAGLDHTCANCGADFNAWRADCPSCGRWGQITEDIALVKNEIAVSAPLYY